MWTITKLHFINLGVCVTDAQEKPASNKVLWLVSVCGQWGLCFGPVVRPHIMVEIYMAEKAGYHGGRKPKRSERGNWHPRMPPPLGDIQ